MDKYISILMLEDNVDDATLIQKCLERGNLKFTATVVTTKQEFVDALNNHSFDLVLSDHSLPQFNSSEALQIVRAEKPFMPFIVLTGAVSEDFAISIFEKGADNYIMKDNLKRLPSAILKAIETQTELAKNANKK